MKKYAIWKDHKVVGYIELTEEQKETLNKIPGIGVYFGFDRVTQSDRYEEDRKLFCYSAPNMMDGYMKNQHGHRYTDDVAVCYANSLDEAIEKFSKLYSRDILVGNVSEVKFNSYGICVCTDY